MPLDSTFTLPFTAVNTTFGDLKLTPRDDDDCVSAELTQVNDTQGYITFSRNDVSFSNTETSIPAIRSFYLEDLNSGISKIFSIKLCYVTSVFYIISSAVSANKLTIKSRMCGQTSYNNSVDILKYTVTGVVDNAGNMISKPLQFSVVEPSGFFGEVVTTRHYKDFLDTWCDIFIHEPFVGQVSVTIQGTYSGMVVTQIFTVNIK